MLSSGSGAYPRTETGASNFSFSASGAAPIIQTGPSYSAHHSHSPTTIASVAPSPMPVPLAPYPSQPQMMQAPPGSQGHVVCNGCRRLLVYPLGATNVRCALCSCITAVSPHGAGADVAQLICGGCRTLLMYSRGASSVQCSCCNTVNLALEANQVAQVNCGGCGTLLMYPYGAQSVKCALCQFVSTIGTNRVPLPPQRPTYVSSPQPSPASQPVTRTQTQTVVVENPMTLDENGKLVSNVAVGVTSEKR